MASVGEKFDAAVSVIKKLPKNGPFQPSYELMKRFYGLYKQATEGPCHQSKPAFWNVVQTQKWQAWSVLGDMASEEAKRLYVEELLQTILDNSKAQDIPHLYKIIETMPQTEDVVTFLKVMGPFFELVHEEEPEKAAASTPQVTMVNGHVNGGVKMKETKVDERGDQALQNGDLSDVSDYTNGHLEGDHYMNGGSRDKTEVTDHLDSSEADEKVNGHGKEEKKEEETKESRFVRVETSHEGENSAELSHPILISKSQLEAAAEHQPSASESESDGDEFCDSVDVPLINTLSLAHISKADSLPSVTEEEEERRKQLTSTPFNGDHAVVTRAEVHNNVDAVIEPHYTTSSSTAPTTSTPCMRGGGEVTGGSKGQQGQDTSRAQTGQGHSSSGYQPSDSFQNLRSSGSQDSSFGSGRQGGRGGGAGGGSRRTPGGDGSPLRSPLPDGVVEQITISLERLQRDMNSVLVRLNTLETIAISRHQLETQQAYMREGIPLPQDSPPIRPPPRQASSPSWWPFPTLPMRTVFILLVWPFIVQWILRFLARHRRARPPPR